MKPLGLVVAMDSNFVIGVNGTIPWHYKEDMQHFKKTTIGHPVIMGRHTWDSIPKKFKPLPGRKNIILTRNIRKYKNEENTYFVCSFKEALEKAYSISEGKIPMVIGGSNIYSLALPLATHLWITRIPEEVEIQKEDAVTLFNLEEKNIFDKKWTCVQKQILNEEKNLVVEAFRRKNDMF
jgi:dihydrofolate reductase